MADKKTDKKAGEQVVADAEATEAAASDTSREVTFKVATKAQAKAYLSGNPEAGRVYKLGKQGRNTVLMIGTR